MSMPSDPISAVVWSASERAEDGEFRKSMIRLEMTLKPEIEQLQHEIKLLRSELKSGSVLFGSTLVEHVGGERRLQAELRSVGKRFLSPTGPHVDLDPPARPISLQDSSRIDDVGLHVSEVELEEKRGDNHSNEWSCDNAAVYDEDEAKHDRAKRLSFVSARTKSTNKDLSQSWEWDANPSFRERVRSIVNSSKFEAFFSGVIFTNCIFLGIVADFRATYPGDAEHAAFKILEYCYTGLFAAELFTRILGEGTSAYCDVEKMHWYILDTFVVVTSLIEVAIEAVQQTSKGMSFSGARIFRVIRIIRIIKVVRVARVVRFVRALRILVLSLMHTMRAVLWAFVLLLAIIYVFALIFVQLVTEHAQSNNVASNDSLMLFWGTLPRSMFTLYMSIASGISWYDVVRPLGGIANWLVAVFIVFISFTVFAVLNVITGVFCEAAIEGARQDNEMMLQQHLAEKKQFTAAIYTIFGVKGQGDDVTLTYAEFVDRLSDPRTKAHLAAIELDVNDAWELFRLLDTDDSAIIDVEEFVVGCLRLKGFAKAIDLAKLDYESKMRAKRLVEQVGSIDRRVGALTKHLLPLVPSPSRPWTESEIPTITDDVVP